MLDCTGSSSSLMKTVDMMYRGGKIVFMEWTGNDLDQLPLTGIMAKGISLMGLSWDCGHFSTAIELANSGSVNLTSIVSHNYRFSEISVAFDELSKETSDMIKAIIKFEAEED